MSTNNPYDALGRILSSGGEISVGLGILRGYGQDKIGTLFSRKFGDVGEQERKIVTDLALKMIESGAEMSNIDPSENIPLSMFPVNEFLFGEDTEGRRARVTVEVELPGATSRVLMQIDLADIGTLDELNEMAMDQAGSIAKQYPEKFGLTADSDLESGNVFILLPQRRF